MEHAHSVPASIMKGDYVIVRILLVYVVIQGKPIDNYRLFLSYTVEQLFQNYKTPGKHQLLMNNYSPKSKREYRNMVKLSPYIKTIPGSLVLPRDCRDLTLQK
jgi:hypothetical protein